MLHKNSACRREFTHHGGRGRGLIHLVLGGFDLGLQVRRRVKVFALVSGAAALYVIHAHGHRVIAGVDHCAVGGVGEPAVRLSARAVAALVLTAHLRTHAAVGCHGQFVLDVQCKYLLHKKSGDLVFLKYLEMCDTPNFYIIIKLVSTFRMTILLFWKQRIW